MSIINAALRGLNSIFPCVCGKRKTEISHVQTLSCDARVFNSGAVHFLTILEIGLHLQLCFIKLIGGGKERHIAVCIRQRIMGVKGLSEELRDTVVERCRSGQEYKRISAAFMVPKTTLASANLKRTKFGAGRTLPRAGYLAKLGNQGRRVREQTKSPKITEAELLFICVKMGESSRKNIITAALWQSGPTEVSWWKTHESLPCPECSEPQIGPEGRLSTRPLPKAHRKNNIRLA